MTGNGNGTTRSAASFDRVAPDYDRYRRGYPRPVTDHAATAAAIGGRSRVLEIGCGTGQLTAALAARAGTIDALEPGRALAARARQNLAPFPRVRVETGAFETFALPARPYDAVVCANAFHWLRPDVRLAKAAAALAAGGRLVIIHPSHVRGGTPGFFAQSQRVYRAWGLARAPAWQPPTALQAPDAYPEIERSALFGAVGRRRFERTQLFSARAYVGMLRTDSLILAMDGLSRQGFLVAMGRLIEDAFGGEIRRNYLYEVVVARRGAPAEGIGR